MGLPIHLTAKEFSVSCVALEAAAIGSRILPAGRAALQMLTAIVLVGVVLKATIFESFFVPSTSMAPTLQVDDYIIVPKFSYGLHLPFVSTSVATWAEPERGDVVVFRRADDPRTMADESSRTLVKRVIAVGGDYVEVRGQHVFVNGRLIHEPYAHWDGVSELKDFPPRQVPSGSAFVLGDNRAESQDSRFWSSPFVQYEHVLGRAIFVYWSKADTNRVGIKL